ncbi:hypothetical protein FNU76_18470 [Chitinimonas arctica]|uniref:TIR domain-containing protein n=1 Tax=Chitinimonas arctica TaxID=2594795 RepID=A0A516SJ32_9NEIS|nr:hypothetical protein [Chitinimonas arctica]QDQ28169.1 hypothetical protein FNU76_18470 [Chitinimonas arctica]
MERFSGLPATGLPASGLPPTGLPATGSPAGPGANFPATGMTGNPIHPGVARVSRNDPALTRIEIQRLGDGDAEGLAQALASNQHLTKLSLVNCTLTPPGARMLVAALAKHASVTKFDLSNIPVSAAVMRELADGLKSPNPLRKLVLHRCRLDIHGAREVAELLKCNQDLHTLKLSHNEIGVEGARDLADAIAGNNALATVSLIACQLGPEGKQIMLEAESRHRNLIAIEVDDTAATQEGERRDEMQVFRTLYGVGRAKANGEAAGQSAGKAIKRRGKAMPKQPGTDVVNLPASRGSPVKTPSPASRPQRQLDANAQAWAGGRFHNLLNALLEVGRWIGGVNPGVVAEPRQALAEIEGPGEKARQADETVARLNDSLNKKQAELDALRDELAVWRYPALSHANLEPVEPAATAPPVPIDMTKSKASLATQRQCLIYRLERNQRNLKRSEEELSKLQCGMQEVRGSNLLSLLTNRSDEREKRLIAMARVEQARLQTTCKADQARLDALELRAIAMDQNEREFTEADILRLQKSLAASRATQASLTREWRAKANAAYQARQQLQHTLSTLNALQQDIESKQRTGLSADTYHFAIFLDRIKQINDARIDYRPPVCLICHVGATPVQDEHNRRLQSFLVQLQRDLTRLGATVWLDLDTLDDSRERYLNSLAECDHMIWVGTPDLRDRSLEPAAEGGENPVQTELGHFLGQIHLRPACVLPLLFEGEAATSIPAPFLERHDWLDFRSDYMRSMAQPLGLISCLFGIDATKADYRQAAERLERQLGVGSLAKARSAPPPDGAAGMIAFRWFLLGCRELMARREMAQPTCYLSSAVQKPALQDQLDRLRDDLQSLGLKVWGGDRGRQEPSKVEEADFVILFGSSDTKRQAGLYGSTVARELAAARAHCIPLLPLMFEGTPETVFPEDLGRVVVHDFRRSDQYNQRMSSLHKPRGLIPAMYGLTSDDKSYQALVEGLEKAPKP